MLHSSILFYFILFCFILLLGASEASGEHTNSIDWATCGLVIVPLMREMIVERWFSDLFVRFSAHFRIVVAFYEQLENVPKRGPKVNEQRSTLFRCMFAFYE